MSISKNLVSLSLAAITLPVLHAASGCPENVVSLHLRLVQSSLIVVPVQINQSGPYDFIVDTGAQTTTVDPSLASELHLATEGTTGVGGVATFARSSYTYLESLQAGSHSIPHALAVVQELSQLKAADPRIRGILGANFLQHFDILIDNRQHILCLDDTDTLAKAVKGKHVDLAEPRGSQQDLPFTRPIVVSVRLSADDTAPVLLRLDSGSNAPVLYAAGSGIRSQSKGKNSTLKRVANGTEQSFAVLAPQDVQVGTQLIRQVSFIMPMNAIGASPATREDGLLPTMAFQRVFISSSGRYATLDPW